VKSSGVGLRVFGQRLQRLSLTSGLRAWPPVPHRAQAGSGGSVALTLDDRAKQRRRIVRAGGWATRAEIHTTLITAGRLLPSIWPRGRSTSEQASLAIAGPSLFVSYPSGRVSRLDAKTLKSIGNRIGDQTGRKVELSSQVDPDILGGIVLRVGNSILDASIRNRLEQLRKQVARPR